jgi:hypothetical protein
VIWHVNDKDQPAPAACATRRDEKDFTWFNDLRSAPELRRAASSCSIAIGFLDADGHSSEMLSCSTSPHRSAGDVRTRAC